MRNTYGMIAALFAMLALAGPAPAAAQDTGAITGVVTDAQSGNPISGAQVTVVGTGLGALTNTDGRYLIRAAPAGNAEIRVDYIGYSSQQRIVRVPEGGTATQDFELGVSAISIDQVVVTATGRQRARELGHSVASVNATETLETKPVSSLTGLLTAEVPGVKIQQPTGSVAAASSFKIRGNTSIDLSNTPIIYVDGARIDNSNYVDVGAGGQAFTRINDINPQDIESIEIVKGPAATTLYGTDASAGVVRITTKSGSAGDAVWNAYAEYGFSEDATDWWEMAWSTTEGLGLELLTGVPAARDTVYTMNLLEGQAYLDSPFRTGQSQTLGASVRGGNEMVRYFLSGERLDRTGVLPSDGIERYSVRGNFDMQPTDRLRLNVSTGFVSSDASLPENDNSLYGFVGNALGTPFFGPMVASDPNDGGAELETCFIAYELALAGAGSLEDLTGICASPYFVAVPNSNERIGSIQNRNALERFTGSATLQWTPRSNLNTRLTIGYDQYSSGLRRMFEVDPVRPFGQLSEGYLYREEQVSRNVTLEGTTALNLDFTQDLAGVTTVGVQWFRESDDFTAAEGQTFPAGSPSVSNAVDVQGFDAFSEARTLGFFAQQQFSWRDRVFLTPGIRYDDNSAFGSDLEGELYPRLSFSWILSEEDFFPAFADQFKLRAAWGQSGRRPGTNAALALLSPTAVTFRNSNVLGVSRNRPGNPELRPAVTAEYEFGFDASVLDNRLGASFTYFDKKTEDDIISQAQAPSLGFPGAQFLNIGEITARGMELALNGTPVVTDNVRWRLDFSLATVEGEITELPEPIVFGSQRHQEGLPFGAYYDETVTINDNGEVEVGDAQFLGQPTPEWEGGIGSTLTLFDRVSLFALIDYAGGHQQENGLEAFNCGLFGGGGQFGTCPAIFERDAEGNLTDEARIKDTAAAIGSDAPFIYDADYAKLRNVSLRIELPDAWANRLGSSRASLTLSGRNLHTWTDYSGTDPEANFAGSAQATRSQLWTLPQSREFLARLQFTF